MTGFDGWPPLLELRQYTLRPGRRDDLVELFDTEFVESQEALGMGVHGQFRDLDDPDRFVWLRGYPDGSADRRRESLAAFYGGPVWAAHGAAANATMVDSDDVFLLAPLTPDEPFAGAPTHPPVGSDPPRSVFDLTVCLLADPADADLRDWVSSEVVPLVRRLGTGPVAAFASSDVPNTFPALPVREDEPVIAWLVRLDDADSQAAYRRGLEASEQWQQDVWPRLEPLLRRAPLRLRLAPTGRSRLR
ncbi:MAG: NIPSNAP family protein [Nocardioidaceae bacterium]